MGRESGMEEPDSVRRIHHEIERRIQFPCHETLCTYCGDTIIEFMWYSSIHNDYESALL